MDRGDIAEDIWYLQHAAFREEVVRLGVKTVPPLMETVDDLRRTPDTYIGYEKDGEWIGAVSYYMQGRLLKLRRLMVHPAYFRQGVGTALLNYLLSHTPHDQAEVHAGERNDPAVGLYRKMGFYPVEKVKVSDGFELLRFVRNSKSSTTGRLPI